MSGNIDHDPKWPTILLAGGMCWLLVTVAEVLWVLPMSGTESNGTYVVSSAARFANHAVDFIVATIAYRIAIHLGWPDRPGARVRVLLIHVAMAAAVLRIAMLATTLSAAYIDGKLEVLRDDDGSFMLWDANYMSWLGSARFTLPPYLLGLALVALVLLARRYRRNTVQMAQLSVDYANARITALSAQLQPHFLFNSLHAISELVDESPARATDMIARLGDFLRHALESSKQPWISVRSEIEGLEAYIAVQRTRFRGQLDVEIDAAVDTLSLTLPSLLLQPLVENAIEHGRRNSDESLLVRVEIRRQDARLQLRVTNSSPTLAASLPPSAFGDGLNNVGARLRAAYGADAHLEVGPGPQGGTSALVTIPALFAPPGAEAAA